MKGSDSLVRIRIFREGGYPRTKGVVVGGTDHRGDFEIVAVK
jgi:hypothetical protein